MSTLDLEVDATFGNISNAWSENLSFLFDSPSSERSPVKASLSNLKREVDEEDGWSPESDMFKFEEKSEEEQS